MNVDNQIFWKLIEPVHAKAEAFCRKLAGNKDEGDDLYQDSLLLALRKFAQLRDQSALRPWLFRIIVNSFKNSRRQPWWKSGRESSAGSPVSDDFDDPRSQYELNRWLEKALGALSAENRALIILYEIEGWEIAELSRMFKRPSGTIKARLSRSRFKMRTAIEKQLARDVNSNSADEVIYALQRSKTAD